MQDIFVTQSFDIRYLEYDISLYIYIYKDINFTLDSSKYIHV